MRILERIEENHFNIFTQRPIITTSDKVRSLWRGITQRVRA
jgi:hypothetical protein